MQKILKINKTKEFSSINSDWSILNAYSIKYT
jgi:hypothetical protein